MKSVTLKLSFKLDTKFLVKCKFKEKSSYMKCCILVVLANYFAFYFPRYAFAQKILLPQQRFPRGIEKFLKA